MENENQNSPRLVPFLIISFLIFLGWSFAYEKFFPKPKPQQPETVTQVSAGQNQSAPSTSPTAATPTPDSSAAPVPVTQAELKQLQLNTELWKANLSNQGAVITSWTMTRFTDGQAIDEKKGGVNLVSDKLSQEQGSFFRFYIPADQGLEKELNEARYAIESITESQLNITKGAKREISFAYNNNSVAARKKFIFKGQGADNASGYDFDFIAEVTRNGQPIEAFVVIGPNFGDHAVVEVSTYKHAPQISYAVGTKVHREQGSGFKGAASKPLETVTWAGVDDNYFAMVFVPARPVPAIGLNQHRTESIGGKSTERDYVSTAVKVISGQTNHVYAGPKALDTLEQMTVNFGLTAQSAGLEDIISYGLLDFISSMVKPIARFMLGALRYINKFTNNWGWAIVLLTIALNMIFFPLRYYSSKKMKGAAAMQPKMKALQDEMAKLDKNDPRVLELQKQQLALMKDGNPLMGCLPLLLQMPFFMAVFAILTVSIEVRHAPFFGWLQDLSAPDPYWLLPIVMCVTMIAQTALTPTTADPVQKRVSYIMPVILTYFFFISAPAGLVLYWMMGNFVGVVQQYVINKLTGKNTPADAAATDAASNNAVANKSDKKKPAKAAAGK